MESGDTFNCTVKVKQERSDVSLNDNEYYQTIDKAPDAQNVEFFQFMHRNSIQRLKQEYDETAEPHKDMEIIFECKDVKPDTGLLVLEKMEDYSENHLQNMILSDQTQKTIKVEKIGVLKEEFFGEEAEKLTMNSDYKLSKQNDKRRVEETSIYKHRLKTPIDQVSRSISCDTCGLKFTKQSHLKRHNDTKHRGIRHACNECGNSFTQRPHLKTHIETVHNGVTHACNQCGRSYSKKSYLKIHIHKVHLDITYVCDVCKKKFSEKKALKRHADSAHNGVSHVCDVCEKKFSDKSNLKKHVDSMHNGIIHACDKCEKKYKYQTDLLRHVNSSHNDITYSCNKCGKSFTRKSNLKMHIDVAHH
ncbi:zinc finger and SCAN domain-containing protein 12-like [Trichogramma pretiosum]|uniref:zinc finger and SCAN domain-containing protein 12-like n=1 Tax=Trichogramma pretiosum TaxID=7493 RepID=UPI0006C96592|nr:zinc finger and SCAN domain-containing protein 12-like [Trichogramma pretiosum]